VPSVTVLSVYCLPKAITYHLTGLKPFHIAVIHSASTASALESVQPALMDINSLPPTSVWPIVPKIKSQTALFALTASPPVSSAARTTSSDSGEQSVRLSAVTPTVSTALLLRPAQSAKSVSLTRRNKRAALVTCVRFFTATTASMRQPAKNVLPTTSSTLKAQPAPPPASPQSPTASTAPHQPFVQSASQDLIF
jgi:hypothetical protein